MEIKGGKGVTKMQRQKILAKANQFTELELLYDYLRQYFASNW